MHTRILTYVQRETYNSRLKMTVRFYSAIIAFPTTTEAPGGTVLGAVWTYLAPSVIHGCFVSPQRVRGSRRHPRPPVIAGNNQNRILHPAALLQDADELTNFFVQIQQYLLRKTRNIRVRIGNHTNKMSGEYLFEIEEKEKKARQIRLFLATRRKKKRYKILETEVQR